MISPQRSKNVLGFLAFGIIAWVFFLFYPILNSYFVSDDFYIWSLVRSLRFGDTYKLFLPHVLGGFNLTDYTEHYIPLTVWIMWFITIPLSMSSFAGHLISLSLHLVNTLLVGRLGLFISRNKRIAFLSALIFGSFPFITEAVSYVTANLFLLGALFYLLTTIFLLKAIITKQNKWYLFHTLSFGLGMLSAEVVITVPLTSLVLFWTFENKSLFESLRIHHKLFYAYAVTLGIYGTLRVLSIGTVNIFVSTGHYGQWVMSRMFIVYVVVLIVLIIMRIAFSSWIPKEILKKEKRLWIPLLLTGISWLPTATLLTQERYLYLPATFATMFSAQTFFVIYSTFRHYKMMRILLIFLLVISLSINGILTYRSSSKWLHASNVAHLIVVDVSQIVESRPAEEPYFYLVNIPDSIDGAIVHRSFFLDAVEFYSGKRPTPFIFTPLTYGIDVSIQPNGPRSARLTSQNGFSLFMPTRTTNGNRMIEWPNKYRAIEIDFHTLEVEFTDPDFTWKGGYVYGFEKNKIKQILP